MANYPDELLFREPDELTQVSVYLEGEWIFQDLNAIPWVTSPNGSFRYYQSQGDFAILDQNERDPSKGLRFGDPLDYLVLTSDSRLTIMNQRTFELLV